MALIHLTHGYNQRHSHRVQSSQQALAPDTIPYDIRVYWMRRANAALAELASPCPFGAFGSVVVNHTDTSSDPKGKLVCMSVNQNMQKGNPTLHGEISAINNCSEILTDPHGDYRLSTSESLKAFSKLSLYTNAEPCPMCASAIRWSGFAECIFGTSIETLVEKGWGQISIYSDEVFEESKKLPSITRLIRNVLANETDPFFSWQFNPQSSCPEGCTRTGDGKSCREVEEIVGWEL
ncbi:cytidine deaminase-like protein [Hyaloscypha finlandica]|nr:cytidine deaminase-like protein [Hyaloscypha finlandica]